jgi:hypothetical protein
MQWRITKERRHLVLVDIPEEPKASGQQAATIDLTLLGSMREARQKAKRKMSR